MAAHCLEGFGAVAWRQPHLGPSPLASTSKPSERSMP